MSLTFCEKTLFSVTLLSTLLARWSSTGELRTFEVISGRGLKVCMRFARIYSITTEHPLTQNPRHAPESCKVWPILRVDSGVVKIERVRHIEQQTT